MKTGDLVRYAQDEDYVIETNTALVVEVYPAPRGERPMVRVLWDDGEMWTHDIDEFEVVARCRILPRSV